MNTVASIRIAEMAKDAGVERLLFASSCSIYDRGVLDEERDILLNETAEVAPTSHYALSKLEAERGILPLASPSFAPMAFRMGTLYGASPRMRFDLVVNSFVRDALTKGHLRLFYGGAMWRPLVGITDVCRGYLAALMVDPDVIRGQVVNLSGYNLRIAELALRVRARLLTLGVLADVVLDTGQAGVRSYRVSAHKAKALLGWRPQHGIEAATGEILSAAKSIPNLTHPRYSNIAWMQLLEDTLTVSQPGYVLRRPAEVLT
jgi:nucleoside-diphosphate-sugar epimerase